MVTIQTLLDGIPEKIRERQAQKVVLEKQFQTHMQDIVIYGCGNLGCNLGESLLAAGWEVRYYIDANKDTEPDKRILNLQDSADYLSPDALIIVAVYNIYREFAPIRALLREKGFQNIHSVLELRVWPELFQSGHLHDSLSWDIAHIPTDRVLRAYELMGDELSRQSFEDVLRFFISSTDVDFHLCPPEQQYMPGGVYQPLEKEHIIDCGAFDGDSMRAFAERLPGVGSYVGIEPDPKNYQRLQESIQRDLPEHLRAEAIQAAVSDSIGSAMFEAVGNSTSHITAGVRPGMVEVPVVTLDDVITEPVTLIKMDVEGFELRAMNGAERLIQKNQPLLQICVYHRQSDLWEIPLYLRELLPNHRILLRNYAGVVEYVCYAVPADRVVSECGRL